MAAAAVAAAQAARWRTRWRRRRRANGGAVARACRRRAAAPPGGDPSGLPPVPAGGPAVFPIHAAAGVEYGEGFAGNAHRHAPDGWLPSVKYLVEELGADVNSARRWRLHAAPSRSRARRQRNDSVSRLEGRGRQGGQPPRPDHGGHGERPGVAHLADSPRRSRCSRSSARRTTTSARAARRRADGRIKFDVRTALKFDVRKVHGPGVGKPTSGLSCLWRARSSQPAAPFEPDV